MKDFIKKEIVRIRHLIGDRAQVIGAVSGGVDSTVAAKLMQEAIGMFPTLPLYFVSFAAVELAVLCSAEVGMRHRSGGRQPLKPATASCSCSAARRSAGPTFGA